MGFVPSEVLSEDTMKAIKAGQEIVASKTVELVEPEKEMAPTIQFAPEQDITPPLQRCISKQNFFYQTYLYKVPLLAPTVQFAPEQDITPPPQDRALMNVSRPPLMQGRYYREYLRNVMRLATPAWNAHTVHYDIEFSFKREETYRIMNEKDVLTAAAKHYGIGVETLTLAAETARTAEKAIQSAGLEQEKAVKAAVRLFGLTLMYQLRLKNINLPKDGGFTSEKQSAAAARLSETYRELKSLQIQFGREVTKKHPDVNKAEKLRAVFNYKPRREKLATAHTN